MVRKSSTTATAEVEPDSAVTDYPWITGYEPSAEMDDLCSPGRKISPDASRPVFGDPVAHVPAWSSHTVTSAGYRPTLDGLICVPELPALGY
jgi:hypothetical protein